MRRVPFARAAALTFLAVLTASPASAQSINARAAERALIGTALGTVDAEIRTAQQSITDVVGLEEEYTHGRLAILEHTRAMLQQRALANQFNVALQYTVAAETASPTTTPPTVLTAEIQRLAAEIAVLEKRLGAGPDAAINAITLATLRLTMAGLRQRQLFDQFGIPMVIAVTAPSVVTAPPSTADRTADLRAKMDEELQARADARRAEAEQEAQALDIFTIDTAFTETNRVFARAAWKLRVKNFSDHRRAFDITLEWHDASGFVVHSDREYNAVIDAYDDHEFTGSALIPIAAAGKVKGIKAKIRGR